MPDLMNAEEAKALLGCDDATLNNYVNNGTIRAQRLDGMLMLMREDVINLSGMSFSDSDDGTIILSGDSEDLSIDLGEVVDDSSVTMVQSNASDDQADSITFGDELEVVSFEDENASRTEELSFDDADATQNLTFTDSNTAIGTDVNETVIGTGTATATATSDFQTVDYGDDEDEAMVTGASVRRSVRSQRVRTTRPKTSPIWPIVLILTFFVGTCFVLPYFYLMSYKQEGSYYNGERKHGVTDMTIWTSIADSITGFSLEPDEGRYMAATGGSGEWRRISAADPGQKDLWRFKEWRGTYTPELRPESFHIDRIEFDESVPYDDYRQRVPLRGSSLDAAGSPMETFSIVPDSNASTEQDKRYRVD